MTVKIPNNWTAKEAEVVYDFLTDVMAAIWDCYEDQLIERYREEEQNKLNDEMEWADSEAGYDEIPF